jgi:deoxyadenosine/deoxycytidine kinase
MQRYFRESERKGIAVFERSLKSTKEIFLERMHSIIAIEDYKFLEQLLDLGIQLYETSVVTIVLTCTTEEALRRVKARNRIAERKMG